MIFNVFSEEVIVVIIEVQGEIEEKKKVLIIFIVLVDMVQNVVGDKLVVEFIICIGVEIYGYELIFSDIVKVQDVDLIFYNGMNLECWFE